MDVEQPSLELKQQHCPSDAQSRSDRIDTASFTCMVRLLS